MAGNTRATMKTGNKQIEALGRMNLATLRKLYKATFGRDTASRNRDALRKRLASHFTERADAGGAKARPRDERLPPAKTVLERVHEGKTHKVTVLDDGFQYGSKKYGSLSTIAKEITGTIWNGFVFFGTALKEARS